MPKARAKDTPEGPHRFTERDFEPYALAIGQFCLAWNDLHERLGILFLLLCSAKRLKPGRGNKSRMNATVDEYNSLSVHAGVWSSAHYDRPKRDMLRAVVERVWVTQKFPELTEGIQELLKHATSLEDTRNIIVHTPFHWGPPYVDDQPPGPLGVRPNVFLGNQRAHRFSKISFTKKILDEIKWAHDAVLVLRDYAASLESVLTGDVDTWPGKPRLPNRGHGQEAKSQRADARPPPPPRSSKELPQSGG
jgi:hypothetical protein